MLTYRVGAAGDFYSAGRMADHLMEQTQEQEAADLALYYQRGMEASEVGKSVPEPRRDMNPDVAERLGIDQNKALVREEVAYLLSGSRADGKPIEGKQIQKATEDKGRNGFIDLCFSVDKSVSVAWAFAPTEAERNIIMQAHRDAVDSAMRYIEQEVGWARKGHQGLGGIDKGSIGWIKFDHYTSRSTLALRPDDAGRKTLTLAKDSEARDGSVEMIRIPIAGDPNLHTHVAVPNMVLTESGRVGAIDFQRLEGRIKEFGAIYQAFVATNLRRSGVEVALDEKTGAARVTAIPENVRDAFSKRTRDAHETARQYAIDKGVDWDSLTPEAQVKWLKGGAGGSRRSKTDDVSDVQAWQRQANALGWKHESILDRAKNPECSREDRLALAYEASLPFLESEFSRRSVLMGSDARIAAARGLVAAGIDTTEDVNAVTALMRRYGISQDGLKTALMWGKTYSVKGQQQTQITTSLHVSQEKELIGIAREASMDTSLALKRDELWAAVKRSGLTFNNSHGANQQNLMERIGMGGKLSVGIGAAGSGKTAVLRPLVDAWHDKGLKVYGAALAWRQSDDLAGAGIKEENRAAIAAFIYRAKKGKYALDNKSVVVVDELGQLGVRQALDLLRLQKQYGFKLVALGDEKQCQSVDAGPVIDLFRKALGKETIPEVLTTIRQKSEREREISLLFRDGKAGEALKMKRQDGTVQVVPGGRREAIERIADLWQERCEANRNDKSFSISVSAPTNSDARDISTAIRERRRKNGEIGNDKVVVKATDQHGTAFELPLAVGDRVRLFNRVNASFGNKAGIIGNNGSVLEVRVVDKDGLVLRAKTGTEGRVKWSSLRDEKSGRIRLSYGDAGTIDSQQGITSTEHIDALPSGTKSVQGFKAYVAESRHQSKAWMVTSEGAERQEIVDRRALGDARPIQEKDVWENMARNLSRQPAKLAATSFLQMAEDLRRGTVQAFQKGLQLLENREVQGMERSTLHHTIQQRYENDQAVQAVQKIAQSMDKRREVVNDLEQRAERVREIMADMTDDIENTVEQWATGAGKGSPVSKPKAHMRPSKPAKMPKPAKAKREPVSPDHIKTLKDSVSLTHLIGQSLKLDHDGKTCCPFHAEQTASFYVNEKNGFFHCFGCGEHGDAVDWLQKGLGMRFRDAVAYLEDRSGISLPSPMAPRTGAAKEAEWKPVYPVPDNVPPLIGRDGRTVPVFNPKRVGTDKEYGSYRPAHIASYQDKDGRQVGYVIRVEIKDKDARKDRKFTPQITWCVPSQLPKGADPVKEGRWAIAPMADPRPLYHAERLAMNPDVPVIVVGGEKKADALQKVIKDDAVVVSWPGGDHGRHHVDFSTLEGRDVIVWPDADQSGIAAALGKEDRTGSMREGVCSMVERAGAKSVRMVIPPDNVVKGWDCGDLVKGGADKEAVRVFLNARVASVDKARQQCQPEHEIDLSR